MLLNALGFQLCWLAWVAGAGRGLLWPGLVCTLAFAAWQLAVSPWRRADLLLVAASLAVGIAVDGLWSALGMIEYRLPGPLPAPLWILGLWAVFALTLNHSLAFLGRRPALAALLGGTGAPVAYGAAIGAWDAGSFLWPAPLALGTVAIAWAPLTAGLALLALRLRGEGLPAPPLPAR
ncbi:MAG: DUF2878 domain-containing protein [Xanthomonadales bacterium]|nr:DUF2878 domain-containing protein [Xanthomonadales bacterium]